MEDGLSFVENAIKKARHAAKQVVCHHLLTTQVLRLMRSRGKPGIYSARFSGNNATDELNNKKLLAELSGVAAEQRTARYQCVIVFLRHEFDPTPIICQGSWEGRILEEPQGNGGFGYDPLFYCSEYSCSAAELSASQKHEISHRGKALLKLKHALYNVTL